MRQKFTWKLYAYCRCCCCHCFCCFFYLFVIFIWYLLWFIFIDLNNKSWWLDLLWFSDWCLWNCAKHSISCMMHIWKGTTEKCFAVHKWYIQSCCVFWAVCIFVLASIWHSRYLSRSLIKKLCFDFNFKLITSVWKTQDQNDLFNYFFTPGLMQMGCCCCCHSRARLQLTNVLYDRILIFIHTSILPYLTNCNKWVHAPTKFWFVSFSIFSHS